MQHTTRAAQRGWSKGDRNHVPAHDLIVWILRSNTRTLNRCVRSPARRKIFILALDFAEAMHSKRYAYRSEARNLSIGVCWLQSWPKVERKEFRISELHRRVKNPMRNLGCLAVCIFPAGFIRISVSVAGFIRISERWFTALFGYPTDILDHSSFQDDPKMVVSLDMWIRIINIYII